MKWKIKKIKRYELIMHNYSWRKIAVPNWEPVSFAASYLYEKELFLTGGWNPNTNTFNSDIWKCNKEFQWKQLANMNSWSPRNGHSVTTFNGKLFLIGGFNYQSRYLEDIWIFDPENSSNEWECLQKTNTWEGREGHVALVFKNSLWIFGGITSSGVKNDIWTTQDGIHWSENDEIAPWTPRCFHNVVIFHDKLCLFAGSAVEGAKNDMYISRNGSDWLQVEENLPFTPHFGSGVCVFDNRIWMVGGSDAKERDFTNEVWWFTEDDGWNQYMIETPWSPRWGFNCVNVYEDKMILLCGGVRYSDRKYSAFADGWILEVN